MIIIIVAALTGALLSPQPVSGGTLLAVRHWVGPENTRIVLDVSDGTHWQTSTEGDQVIIDLTAALSIAQAPSSRTIDRSTVREIRISPGEGERVRVNITIKEGAVAHISHLLRVEDRPERIVIDVVGTEIEQLLAQERLNLRSEIKGRVIILDPGHGGDDPGAIGKYGTEEKDIVLAIARRLQRQIDAIPGYRAFLTRDGDYYVSFAKRLQIARDYGGDLFISIHNDAVRNRTVRGSSVYVLSGRGALSEAARIMARRENLSDIIGDSPNGSDWNYSSNPIVLDMFQNKTINRSKMFGSLLLEKISEIAPLKFRQVQEAPFRVLMLPEIPAVLLEVLYISNPSEEKRLRSQAFQEDISRRVTRAITRFLPREETATSPKLATERSGVANAAVIESSGEGNRRQMRTAEGKSSGQELKNTRIAQTRELKYVAYRVRRGDTLSQVAARHRVSAQELAKINGLGSKDRILIGREIKIPLGSGR